MFYAIAFCEVCLYTVYMNNKALDFDVLWQGVGGASSVLLLYKLTLLLWKWWRERATVHTEHAQARRVDVETQVMVERDEWERWREIVDRLENEVTRLEGQVQQLECTRAEQEARIDELQRENVLLRAVLVRAGFEIKTGPLDEGVLETPLPQSVEMRTYL